MIGALLFGLVAGFIGRALVPNDVFANLEGPKSWLVSIVLGLVGAAVGWLIFTGALGIGDEDVFDWGGILSALIGVILVLLLVGWVMRRTVPEQRDCLTASSHSQATLSHSRDTARAMSQENVEIVRHGVETWNRRDLRTWLALFSADAEIDWSRARGPLKGVYRGRGEIESLWNEFFFTFEEAQIEAHDFTDAGSEVVVSNTSHFRGREGIEVSASSTWVFTVENGQITSLRLFQERTEALEAAGLSEQTMSQENVEFVRRLTEAFEPAAVLLRGLCPMVLGAQELQILGRVRVAAILERDDVVKLLAEPPSRDS